MSTETLCEKSVDKPGRLCYDLDMKRTALEQWKAFARYVAEIDRQVDSGQANTDDAWALVDMELERMTEEELA